VDAEEVHRPAVLPGGPSGNEPRELAVCSRVVGTGAPVVLSNVRRDPRFADNAVLRGLDAAFYAGVPLRDEEGHVLGAFCIMDTEPRELASADLAVLEEMAERLMQEIRERRKEMEG
jgi:GAF domain-containing protein